MVSLWTWNRLVTTAYEPQPTHVCTYESSYLFIHWLQFRDARYPLTMYSLSCTNSTHSSRHDIVTHPNATTYSKVTPALFQVVKRVVDGWAAYTRACRDRSIAFRCHRHCCTLASSQHRPGAHCDATHPAIGKDFYTSKEGSSWEAHAQVPCLARHTVLHHCVCATVTRRVIAFQMYCCGIDIY